jgi:hypothetical protein
MIIIGVIFTLFGAHLKVRKKIQQDTLTLGTTSEIPETTAAVAILIPESDTDTEILVEDDEPIVTEGYTGKIQVNELSELQIDTARAIVKKLICEYYSDSSLPEEIELPMDLSIRRSNVIENETIKGQINYYCRNSANPEQYSTMEDEGIYCSCTGLTENDFVLFEMDNAHFAISEPYSNITDYNNNYNFLFTVRNSDNTTAYYWHAKEASDLVEYPSHRVIRVWVYNKATNSYTYIQ